MMQFLGPGRSFFSSSGRSGAFCVQATSGYVQTELLPPLFQSRSKSVSLGPSLEFSASFHDAVILEERGEAVKVVFALIGVGTVDATESGR
jgi:hypothetical protein